MSNSEYLSFAHLLADEAALLIQKGFRSNNSYVELKSDHSPVTETDRAVEQRLRFMINEKYPQHGICGEEFSPHQLQADYCWIIDPIDGTRAFACGIPTFGTLIALMHKTTILCGLMLQPFTNERWAAMSGTQTQYCRDSVQQLLHTSNCTNVKTARFATTSPYLFNAEQKSVFENIRLLTAIQTYGGDCYNYAMLASGHIDIIMEAGLKPFDIAALIPIIEGAGGIITDWQGNHLALGEAALNILASANPALHEEALEVMNKSYTGMKL